MRCDCCERHISELTPFGKAGDPLVGDFDGELLVKKFRTMGPYDQKADKAYNRVIKMMEEEGLAGADPFELMIKIYGKERGKRYLFAVEAFSMVGSSWECRDCAILEGDEYFDQLYKTCSN
jgi:hypothetical protein